jgi:hypothetical protein
MSRKGKRIKRMHEKPKNQKSIKRTHEEARHANNPLDAWKAIKRGFP